MPNPNAVPSIMDDLYIGEDQAVFIDVDTSNDDSGVPVANWTVEMRLKSGQVPLEAVIVVPDLVETMNYAHIVGPPAIDRFQGTIPKADSIAHLVPGAVTMEIWRTNTALNKQLYRVDFRAYATQSKTA